MSIDYIHMYLTKLSQAKGKLNHVKLNCICSYCSMFVCIKCNMIGICLPRKQSTCCYLARYLSIIPYYGVYTHWRGHTGGHETKLNRVWYARVSILKGNLKDYSVAVSEFRECHFRQIRFNSKMVGKSTGFLLM